MELEVERRLAEGAACRWGEPWDESCRRGGTGLYQKVTITEKEGGVERKTNLALPPFVWVGAETAKWPNAAEGETVAAFLCLFGMSDPPQRKNYFLLRVCSIDEASGEYTGREVWQKLHRGGVASTRFGGMTPPHMCWMPLPNGFGSMLPRGEGGESRRSGGLRWWLLRRMPPHRGKGPTPSPKPSPKESKVAKVAAQPPP